MLRIAICDNDRIFQKQLLDYISRDTDIEDDYRTECFDRILDVQRRLEKRDFNFDLLFLMINESGIDSIALTEYIRSQKFDIDVFFMAKTVDFITDAFRCKAFNYIMKPLQYKKFVYEMKQYLQEKKSCQKDFLAVQIQGKEHLIPLNTVLYFTSDVRRIGAFFPNDEKEVWFYGRKLDDLERQLEPYGYLRCHQSYLVNGCKIEGIQGNEVVTAGGSFPISRTYIERVREKWNYLKEKLYSNANITSLAESMPDDMANEGDLTADGASTMVVTKKYSSAVSKYGVLVGICGQMQNYSYRIYEEDEALIGRDYRQAQIIINDRLISRKHCGIRFSVSEQCYYVYDYGSTNGTSISGMGRLPKGQWIPVPHNSLLQLINNQQLFVLV